MGLRIGIDVGGTFTKSAVVEMPQCELLESASVPTTHRSKMGVSEGVVLSLQSLLSRLGERKREIELVAFSTTQAMNALLEGDVVPVGVIGMGQEPDIRRARRRTRVGNIDLAPGHLLEVVHKFIDTTQGLDSDELESALSEFKDARCEAVAVSESFAVDLPDNEVEVAERARRAGMQACAGHELQKTYGLETRTVSATINASILPVIKRTAAFVEQGLDDCGLDVPLLVLRGDGGAMGLESFRTAPVQTLCSAPAAGAAAALHMLDLNEGIVLEVGGTSSNISVIKQGRPLMRSVKVMGRPTCIRSIDSWVVGVAGGSMASIKRRRIDKVGPRSAHIAGLPYSCFCAAEKLQNGMLELIAPRESDLATYAAIKTDDGTFAITTTCAANALGLVPAGDYAYASTDSAQTAFEILGRHLRRDPEQLAQSFIDSAADEVTEAVEEALRVHKLTDGLPLIALGGAARVLAEEVATRAGMSVDFPRHAEVLSSIGAALSLIRTQVERTATRGLDQLDLVKEAEIACVQSGAAPNSVTVETKFDQEQGTVRAVAVGSVAMQSGAAKRSPINIEEGKRVAADALGLAVEKLDLVAETTFYRVYCENGSGKVAVVDPTGAVPLCEESVKVISGSTENVKSRLKSEVGNHSHNFGVVTLMPRVYLTCGPHLLDLTSARNMEEIIGPAEKAIDRHPENPVAIITR